MQKHLRDPTESISRLMNKQEQHHGKIHRSPSGDGGKTATASHGFFSPSRRMGRAAGTAAQRYCDDFERYSPLARRTKSKRKATATLQSSDIVVGELIGEGNFSQVFEVKMRRRVKFLQSGHDTQTSTTDKGNPSSLETTNYANHFLEEREKKEGDDDQHLQELTYAMKHLRPQRTAEQKKFTASAVDLVMESKMLSCLDHPNIVRLHGVSKVSISEAFSSGEATGYFLILDHLECTLENKIREWVETEAAIFSNESPLCPSIRASSNENFSRTRKKHQRTGSASSLPSTGVDKKVGISSTNGFDEAVCERVSERLRTTVLGVTRGMEYLHRQKIVFRDLKPANVGFTVGGKVKIFDFGLAKEMIDSEQRMTGNTGSLRYMAPEVNRYERYGLPADVYSFGVMLWEICSLNKPFEGMSVKEHSEMVVRRGFRPMMGSVPGSIELQQIIRGCWSSKPSKRPSFKEIRAPLYEELMTGKTQNLSRRTGI